MPSTISSPAATTSSSSAGSTCRGGTTGSGSSTTQRQWMHERYLERARSSGSPWLLVEGSPDERLRTASEAVDRLLAVGETPASG